MKVEEMKAGHLLAIMAGIGLLASVVFVYSVTALVQGVDENGGVRGILERVWEGEG